MPVGHARADTFGELVKVFGVGTDLGGLVWTADEVMVFKSLAGLGVNDGVGFGAVGAGAERIKRSIWIVGVRRNELHVGP